jgi:hypothetical protein
VNAARQPSQFVRAAEAKLAVRFERDGLTAPPRVLAFQSCSTPPFRSWARWPLSLPDIPVCKRRPAAVSGFHPVGRHEVSNKTVALHAAAVVELGSSSVFTLT